MRVYTRAFKQRVIQEHLAGTSKEELRRKYKIKGKSAILNWMRKLEYPNPSPDPGPVFIMAENENLTAAELLKKVKQLERALEDERLRSEGYRRMITKAEEQLKINIRKKSGTK